MKAKIQVISIYKLLWRKAYNNAVLNLDMEEEQARRAANIFAIQNTWKEYILITEGISNGNT